MKKILSIILTLFMMFSIGTTVTACNNSGTTTSSTEEKTNEQKVRDAVNFKGRTYYLGRSIGGNQLRSSSVSITYLYFWSDGLRCDVSGKITVKDIYDTTYSNTFDCKVTTSDNGETWEVSSFTPKASSWTKV